ncbi:MAG: SH3 domain-containing protein [Candidatus Nitrotoga sp. SPKER]|nr:MAG: SH3 domain-containing protein [Candidatus Nitrotoga sp. SPKER]
MKFSVTLTLFIALVTATGFAQALDYASVAVSSAILYDAPSLKAKKIFVVNRYLPLEQVVSLDDWVKVRDSSGSLAWIEKQALNSKRFVAVITPLATVYQSAAADAPVAFNIRQQVALEWLESSGNGWVKVRHPDGMKGYVRATEVWGD